MTALVQYSVPRDTRALFDGAAEVYLNFAQLPRFTPIFAADLPVFPAVRTSVNVQPPERVQHGNLVKQMRPSVTVLSRPRTLCNHQTRRIFREGEK